MGAEGLQAAMKVTISPFRTVGSMGHKGIKYDIWNTLIKISPRIFLRYPQFVPFWNNLDINIRMLNFIKTLHGSENVCNFAAI